MAWPAIPIFTLPPGALSEPLQLLTREQVAAELKCSPQWVSRLTDRRGKDPQLHSVKIGRRTLIPRGSLDAFIKGEKPPWASTTHRWPPEPELPL